MRLKTVRKISESAMAWWVYKCNSIGRKVQTLIADWQDLFDDGTESLWGNSRYLAEFKQLKEGDHLFAYQVDRKELVGIAVVTRHSPDDGNLFLTPVEFLNVKVPNLKKEVPELNSVPALSPGRAVTFHRITFGDPERLLRAARHHWRAHRFPKLAGLPIEEYPVEEKACICRRCGAMLVKANINLHDATSCFSLSGVSRDGLRPLGPVR